jgi:hypothetical protein
MIPRVSVCRMAARCSMPLHLLAGSQDDVLVDVLVGGVIRTSHGHVWKDFPGVNGLNLTCGQRSMAHGGPRHVHIRASMRGLRAPAEPQTTTGAATKTWKAVQAQGRSRPVGSGSTSRGTGSQKVAIVMGHMPAADQKHGRCLEGIPLLGGRSVTGGGRAMKAPEGQAMGNKVAASQVRHMTVMLAPVSKME